MRKKYTEEEVDSIEFTINFNYSEILMKSGISSKKKQAKNNKEKGYTPPEKKTKKILYGVLLMAYGEDVYFDCSTCQDEDKSSDEVCFVSSYFFRVILKKL